MDRESITVLHVDPDESTRATVEERIGSDEAMTVTGVSDIRAGQERLREESIDCIVSAYDLPDGTGFDLFRTGRQHDSTIGCVLFTAEGIADIDRPGDVVVEYLSERIPGTDERLPELVRTVVLDRLQVGYPVPEDEYGRLEAVDRYAIDDILSAQAFDRLLTLVQSYLEVEVAFIGIMHETGEEVVACRGKQWSMVDRGHTICAYGMLEDEVTVIEDVQSDPRFEHNERLRALGIRSYAGAKLTTPDGYVIGELCVTDDVPRSYDGAERETLQLFATEVMEQLELRRRLLPEEVAVNAGERE